MIDRESKNLVGQTALITGSARRLGKTMAKTIAKMGGNLVLHFNHSRMEAEELLQDVQKEGINAWLIQGDLSSEERIQDLLQQANSLTTINILINNASIFSDIDFQHTTAKIWQDHLQVNLTAPFLLSKSFADHIRPDLQGRIINLVDWRALRPGKDHFAYSISKAALTSMTKSLADELAPRVVVNAIALGAILPPENEKPNPMILEKIPLKRWAELKELETLLQYLVTISPALTGQIIHLDGGRHLLY
jgi:pteridine reductase